MKLFKIKLLFIFVTFFFLLKDFSLAKDIKLGIKIPPKEKLDFSVYAHHSYRSLISDFPDNVNWQNFDTIVKDQDYCGSCWSFSLIALLENNIKRKYNFAIDLSEQELLACSEAGDCIGGWYEDAIKYIIKYGIGIESDCPYNIGKSEECDFCSLKNEKRIGIDPLQFRYYYLWDTGVPVKGMIESLQYGPLLAIMKVPNSLLAYKNGVYNYKYDENLSWENNGHAILVVGYQIENIGNEYYENHLEHGSIDFKNLKGYFIVKNSWGTNWGENGYFKISFSHVNDGSAGIEFGSYAVQISDKSIFLEEENFSDDIRNPSSDSPGAHCFIDAAIGVD